MVVRWNIAAVAAVVVLLVTQEAAALNTWRHAKPLNLKHTKNDKEWCDAVLGCLYITDEWYNADRPINVLPDSREKIGTTFFLHTRDSPSIYENVEIKADRASIDASTFDATKPIKFVIHGFIDTGYLAWLREMADSLLANGDYNVVRVDWGGGSLPMYYSASANARVVGLEIAHLVNFLKSEYGVNSGNVHLIGHSLGSHISGYAGEKIAGLGRITGMDPAGPYYTNTPTFVRIDPTDASFVDNIHTNAKSILLLGYGTAQPMGNIDFYPNGGYEQPGCDPVNIGIEVITDIGEGIRDLAACNHGRAYKLFTDILNQACPYLAHECFDYESFETGRCASCGSDNGRCAYMGIRAGEYTQPHRELVKMYLDTDKEPPYCYYHYQVIIDTAHPKEAEDAVIGHIDLTLYGDNGEMLQDFRLTKTHERLEHGQPKYFMFTSHVDLSRAILAEVKWKYDDSLTNPGTYCWTIFCNRSLYVRSVTISPMDYYPEENRLDHQHILCQPGQQYTKIESSSYKTLDYDQSCVSSIQ